MYNRTKNLMIQIQKISRNKGKRRKAHLKLKEWEPTSCRIKKPRSKKIEFSDDSDEHNQDDGHSDTKIEKDYLETKEMNDMSSMPRGESVAFAVTDKPYGEIN